MQAELKHAIPLAPGDVIFFRSSEFVRYNLQGDKDARHSLTMFAHSDMLYEHKHLDSQHHLDIANQRLAKKARNR